MIKSYLKSIVATKLGGLDTYRLKRKAVVGEEAGSKITNKLEITNKPEQRDEERTNKVKINK